MTDPQQVLADRVRGALGAAFGADYASADPLIRPSSFADFQSNAALPLAKKLGKAPREVAEEIVSHLDVSDISDAPDRQRPGIRQLHAAPRVDRRSHHEPARPTRGSGRR